MIPSKYKRMLREILGLQPKQESTRARDRSPEWVKQQAIEKAKQKRENRAEKLRDAERMYKHNERGWGNGKHQTEHIQSGNP